MIYRNLQNVLTVEFWKELLQDIRLVLPLLRDPRVPTTAKLIPIGVLFYLLSPVDLIPGWLIPVLGQLDDLAVIVLGMRWFMQTIPPEIVNEYRDQLGV